MVRQYKIHTNLDGTDDKVWDVTNGKVRFYQPSNLGLQSTNNIWQSNGIGVMGTRSITQPQIEFKLETFGESLEENYQLMKDFVNDILSKKFDIEFPESELALISMYLSKNNVLDVEFNAGVNLLDDEIIDVLQNTLDSLFEQKGIDLRHNEKLLVSLGLHLTPALDRLLEDSQIENPLTEKIKERHPKEFAMAEILNDAIESIYHKRFTEDEVAYFALHFIVSARQK